MPWARIDDMLPLHPKVRALSDPAFRLYICAICWSSMNMTDGELAADQLRFLSDVRTPRSRAAELVTAGLWEETTDGWRIHDYLEYQPSADKVRRERALKAERMERWRNRDASRDASTDASLDAAPIPSHPIPSVSSVSAKPQGSNGSRPDLTLVVQKTIAEHTGVDVSAGHAEAVAAQILAVSQTSIRNPAQYISTAIERDPRRFLPTVQPPPFAAAVHKALNPEPWDAFRKDQP